MSAATRLTFGLVLWTGFFFLFALPNATQFRLPPGGVNGWWSVCAWLVAGLVAFIVHTYYSTETTLKMRLLAYVGFGQAFLGSALLIYIWQDFARETYFRMGGH